MFALLQLLREQLQGCCGSWQVQCWQLTRNRSTGSWGLCKEAPWSPPVVDLAWLSQSGQTGVPEVQGDPLAAMGSAAHRASGSLES